MKLNDLTKDTLFCGLQEDDFKDDFALQLIKVLQDFINKHPLYFMDREDYLNELFMHIWERLDKFDDERGSLTSFIWICSLNWFRMQLRKNKVAEIISLDNEIGKDGYASIYAIDNLCDDTQNTLKDIILEEAMGLVGEHLDLYLKGHNQREISNICGLSQSYVSRLINLNIQQIIEFLQGE